MGGGARPVLERAHTHARGIKRVGERLLGVQLAWLLPRGPIGGPERPFGPSRRPPPRHLAPTFSKGEGSCQGPSHRTQIGAPPARALPLHSPLLPARTHRPPASSASRQSGPRGGHRACRAALWVPRPRAPRPCALWPGCCAVHPACKRVLQLCCDEWALHLSGSTENSAASATVGRPSCLRKLEPERGGGHL